MVVSQTIRARKAQAATLADEMLDVANLRPVFRTELSASIPTMQVSAALSNASAPGLVSFSVTVFRWPSRPTAVPRTKVVPHRVGGDAMNQAIFPIPISGRVTVTHEGVHVFRVRCDRVERDDVDRLLEFYLKMQGRFGNFRFVLGNFVREDCSFDSDRGPPIRSGVATQDIALPIRANVSEPWVSMTHPRSGRTRVHR